MTYITWSRGTIPPHKLYAALSTHKLLPTYLEDNERGLASLASASCYAVAYDDPDATNAKDMILFLMTQTVDAGKMDVVIIPTFHCPHLPLDDKLKETMHTIAAELREAWFEVGGFRRIEARIPTKRKLTLAVAKALGFKCESKFRGVRAYVDYGKGPVDVAMFSLLPGDMPYGVDGHTEEADTQAQEATPEGPETVADETLVLE
jgi:hypothetical protein